MSLCVMPPVLSVISFVITSKVITSIVVLSDNKSGCRNHNTPFSSYLTNGPNELECFTTPDWKGAIDKRSSLLGPFVSNKENEVASIVPFCKIFFDNLSLLVTVPVAGFKLSNGK